MTQKKSKKQMDNKSNIKSDKLITRIFKLSSRNNARRSNWWNDKPKVARTHKKKLLKDDH
jgi:hypothetical protein